MEQLTLNIHTHSRTKIIASSAFDFRIELVEILGKNDVAQIINISNDLSKLFGNNSVLSEKNIFKYFNNKTFPFIARLKGNIIGYIVGVPLEYFKQESWAHFDVNMGKNNTLYTYAFVVNNKHRGKGGYGKTLKRIYLNWAKKKNYKYITGHVKQGIAKKFSEDTQIVKTFPQWYGQKTPFEYYRRPI